MAKFSQTDAENRALALAAFNLTKSLMDALEAKGVLQASEVEAVLDQTLTALEFRAQDNATDLARRIIEATIHTRAAQRRGELDASGGPTAPD